MKPTLSMAVKLKDGVIWVLLVNVSGFWPANGAPGTFVFIFGSDFVPSPGKT